MKTVRRSAICLQLGEQQKSLSALKTDAINPFETAGQYCCRRAIMFTVFNVITTSSA